MRDASSNPKATPVSFVFDGYGNRIDRYELDSVIRLIVTLSARSPRDEQQVIAWYWRYVGSMPPGAEWQEDREHPTNSLYRPEHAVLYDGTPGSGTLPRH
jgi:hypothetical protein